MRQREKTMSLVLIALMTLVLGGLIYFQYYSSTMTTLERSLVKAKDEDEKEKNSLQEITDKRPQLEVAKKISLPPDGDKFSAKREYGLKLEELLRKSEFDAKKSPTVKEKSVETSANAPAAKRPPYTKLTFNVRATCELSMLVDFLDRFYRTPLLHRIRSLTITKPLTNRQGTDLEVVMDIEALILEGAEKRDTLMPQGLSDKELPRVLARSPSQYEMIAGNNIFFGPYTPPPPLPAKQPNRRDAAFVAEIRLNALLHDDNGSRAEFYDEYNQYVYVIRKRADGNYRADSYYLLKDKRKPLQVGEKMLEIQDEHGEVYHKFNILRIDLLEVFLEENDKIYRVHAGEMLAAKQLVSNDEARKLGLPVKDDKKPADKKDSSKTESTAKAKDDAAKKVEKTEPIKKEPEKKENGADPAKKPAETAEGK